MFPQQPELAIPSAVLLMLVALVVNLVTVLFVLKLASRYVQSQSQSQSRPSPGGNVGDRVPETDPGTVPDSSFPSSRSDSSDRRTVRCPECETANEPEYQYCRACVARLPGGASAAQSEFSSFGRFAD